MDQSTPNRQEMDKSGKSTFHAIEENQLDLGKKNGGKTISAILKERLSNDSSRGEYDCFELNCVFPSIVITREIEWRTSLSPPSFSTYFLQSHFFTHLFKFIISLNHDRIMVVSWYILHAIEMNKITAVSFPLMKSKFVYRLALRTDGPTDGPIY